MNEIAAGLIMAGRKLGEGGFCHAGTGNMSAADGTYIYATASGCSLASMEEDDISVLSLSGELISGRKATKEVPFHLAAYRSDPETRAVIHLHTIYSTLVSCMGEEFVRRIELYTPYAAMKAGPVAFIPYYSPGSLMLGEEVLRHPEARSFILANHGMIVRGSSISDAVSRAEELEFSCRIAWEMRNEKASSLLSDEEIAGLRKRG